MNANILISLEPRHAKSILSGDKKVELRRRAPRVLPGTVVWMYSKMPEGSIVGHAKIKKIHEASPQNLWKRFKSQVGVSRAEFFEYFSCRETGVAIELEDTRRLKNPVSLKELRSVDEFFQPPQFFKHLHLEETVTAAVTTAK